VEREGGAISLLPDFEVIEESTNVGEEQVADLGLLLERRLNFREGILEVPVFAGKGKRGPDLVEARRVLTVGAQPRANRPRALGCHSPGGLSSIFPTSTEAFYTVGALLQ
jgi:hypothetical protein